MKVAFIVPALANKGPVLVVKDLVSGLVARNVECKIFYFDDIQEVTMNAPTERISFCKRINFNDFDVVHSHGIRPDAYVFFHKPKSCKALCITTLHNYMNIDLAFQYNRFIAFFATKLWRFLLKKHDKLVVLSNDAKQYYRHFFPRKTIEVAYNSRLVEVSNAENLPFENDILELKKSFSIIGVNALLTERKGVDQLLKALSFLPKHALVIVGNGKEKSALEQLAQTQNVSQRCLFLGYQPNAHNYLKLYDIFAMPSRAEGFPLALLEAAQYQKNVLCSDIPIFKEIFTEKEVTFFELDNISSLVNALKSMEYNDKGERLFMACSERYSMRNFVETYYQIYAIRQG